MLALSMQISTKIADISTEAAAVVIGFQTEKQINTKAALSFNSIVFFLLLLDRTQPINVNKCSGSFVLWKVNALSPYLRQMHF